ncbi:tripartite tricarboxylate transporter substrate-binding protein [Achromobacter insuavis]
MDRRQLLLLAAAAPFGRALAASGYPAQTIRLVAPYAPGGTVDILSRQLAEPMRAGTGQSVIVENRGGAGGTLGADAVAKRGRMATRSCSARCTTRSRSPSIRAWATTSAT